MNSQQLCFSSPLSPLFRHKSFKRYTSLSLSLSSLSSSVDGGNDRSKVLKCFKFLSCSFFSLVVWKLSVSESSRYVLCSLTFIFLTMKISFFWSMYSLASGHPFFLYPINFLNTINENCKSNWIFVLILRLCVSIDATGLGVFLWIEKKKWFEDEPSAERGIQRMCCSDRLCCLS